MLSDMFVYRIVLSDTQTYRVIWVNLIGSRVHDRILEKKRRLGAHRPLPPSKVRKIQQQMQIEYIYNSNAIEGNTLTLRETQLVLEGGTAIGGKSLREHLEAKNHPKAIEYIVRIAGRDLKEQDILALHRLIMKGIEKESGRYRSSEVRIAGANFLSPPAYEVPFLMKELIDWCNQNPDELRPIELASVLHHRFVHIHPFHDGNGRVGRLLMNLVLIRRGYPVSTILNADRKKYYDVLKRADNGHMAPLADFIAATVERSLDLWLRALEPTKKDDILLSLAEASKGSPYSSEYLSLLARKRRIGAVKIGRKWMITKRSLQRYSEELQTDRRREKQKQTCS